MKGLISMPYIKHIPIHTGTYLKNSLEYIRNPNKAYYITSINCPDDINASVSLFKLFGDFELQEIKKNRARIAHHYVQSFEIGKVSSKDAHEIGVGLTKIIAPGYMCHVATHVDKQHIHNHIFIFSIHPETGYKYRHNDDQYKFVQEQSDALCMERGIGIIENPKKRDLTSKEYRAIGRGASWKDKLAWDIDDAIKNAVANNSGKEGFIGYLKSKGYTIKYQDKNISVQLLGNKAVRVDTLAKTYGIQYTKENIERRLQDEELIAVENTDNIVNDEPPLHMKRGDTARFNEYDRYLDWCMKNSYEIQMEAKKRIPPQLDIYQIRDKGKHISKRSKVSSKYHSKEHPEPIGQSMKRGSKGGKIKTWKDKLAFDIDEAIKNAVVNGFGKEGFIDYLKSKGYIVKYQNKNISIQIPGRKAIRVDTLAKTHGIQYTKEGIETRLNGANEDIYDIPIDTKDSAEYIKAGPYRKVRFFRLTNHLSNLSNKTGKTKDEREIERELEELGRFLSKLIRRGCRVNTMKGRWKIKEKKKERKKEQIDQVKKGKER